jgi:hypothetical protein
MVYDLCTYHSVLDAQGFQRFLKTHVPALGQPDLPGLWLNHDHDYLIEPISDYGASACYAVWIR